MAIEDKNSNVQKKSYKRRVKQKRNFILWVEKHLFPVVTVSVLLIASILLFSGWFFVSQFEEGVLEVCADSQDAYVQLVLDQINLKENRDDAQIIEDILGSIDASTNKYWTFSKNETMLFVKDVLETNKYKGFTASTYYETDDNIKFFDDLKLNVVTHGIVELKNKSYVASGVMFEYNGAEYKLCLMTNKDVFLDNNSFMKTKINVGLFFCIAVFLLVVSAMLLARYNGILHTELKERDEMIKYLNGSVSKLNDKLLVKDTYDTRKTLFNEDMLDDFLARIEVKNIAPITIGFVQCLDTNGFLDKSQILLDRGVLRFKATSQNSEKEQNIFTTKDVIDDKNVIILVFLNCDLKNASRNASFVCDDKNRIIKIKEWDKKTSLQQFYNEMRGEINE